MNDVLSVLALVIAGLFVLGFQRHWLRREEMAAFGLAFFGHVLGAFSHIWLAQGYYEGSDVITYHVGGVMLADLVRGDPVRYAPEVLELMFYGEPRLPFWTGIEGSPTASMFAISSISALVVNDSLYGMCTFFSLLAFFGFVALFRVFRETFPDRYALPLLWSTALVPSTILWTSAILKETVAIGALGFLLLGLHRVAHKRYAWGAMLIVVASVPIALVKPYILVAAVLAAAVWGYWMFAKTRSGGTVVIPTWHLLLGGAVALAALVGVGVLFPQFSLSTVSDDIDRMQDVGTRIRGSSYFSVGAAQQGPAARILLAPVALATSLFRPFIFESTGATMLINGLETTVVTVLFARGIWKQGTGAWRIVRSSPLLIFALVFTIVFGIAVGLASTNLGSLSRYRAPLFPFFAALIAVWNVAPRSERAAAPHPTPQRVIARRPAVRPKES